MTDRQVGGLGVTTEVALTPERRVGALGTMIELVGPGPVVGSGARVVGALDVLVEIAPVPARRLGALALLVDYIPSSVLVDAVTWSGSAFGIGGAYPDVHWSGGKFQTGSGPRVLWQDDHFELEV